VAGPGPVLAMPVIRVLPVTAGSYQSHPLHGEDQIWKEKNCSIDVWIEVLHALRLDPVPACASALSSRVIGDQWTFLKFTSEDLWNLYGLTVQEMYIWRPVIDHVEEQLAAGRLVTMEVDSWYLPDTAGTAYRASHVKSTIVPNAVDRTARHLEYFHGPGYWALSGEDFDGIAGLIARKNPGYLPPYVEAVSINQARPADDLVTTAVQLARSHLLRSAENPVARLGERLTADLPWLAAESADVFHRYAFGLIRQCGAAAELAGTLVTWLGQHGIENLNDCADAFFRVAAEAKSLQFQVSRVTRGRSVSAERVLRSMTVSWTEAMALAASLEA
jgi:hypothetical protein